MGPYVAGVVEWCVRGAEGSGGERLKGDCSEGLFWYFGVLVGVGIFEITFFQLVVGCSKMWQMLLHRAMSWVRVPVWAPFFMGGGVTASSLSPASRGSE